MLKHLAIGLLAAGVMTVGTAPVMAKGHTEAVAAACMERTKLSAEECSCIGSEAGPLNAGEVAYLLSIYDGENNNISVARENDTGLVGMARVHWFLRTAVPICAITK